MINYKEKELLYLEGDESQFVRFDWQIPLDAENGYYRLKAEFEPPYIDVLPSINSFWIE